MFLMIITGFYNRACHQRWTLVLISIGMATHALLVGRYLGSAFFLSAMCWGWMAVCGIQGRLEAARSMAIVMTALVLFGIVWIVVAGGAEMRVPILSLCLVPALVSWACAIHYVNFINRRSTEVDPAEEEFADEELAEEERAILYADFEGAMMASSGAGDPLCAASEQTESTGDDLLAEAMHRGPAAHIASNGRRQQKRGSNAA